MEGQPAGRTRIDKWLWAARFFKTRSLASAAVEGGKVQVNGIRVKPAKEIRSGDTLGISIGPGRWVVVVRGLADKRGPADFAKTLYEETAESCAARQALREQAKLAVEPGRAIHGRPTKRDRRRLDRLGGGS